ncbi:MAG TPA: CinA family protein [Chloroflexota bacterium]|nr:CinA family protein [Chloroflexota bacterium]
MARPEAQAIAALLTERHETLAVAETAAGGLISAALAAIPGASAWFLGGAVAYGVGAKERWLGLTASDLAPHGAVSQHAARLMAQRVRAATGATWGLAETGIAGPQTGRRSSKSAGLACLAVDGPLQSSAESHTGLAGREDNQDAFATLALRLLLESLRRAPRTTPAPG